MKYMLVLLSVFSVNALATTVYFDNGTSLTIPENMRLVLVPKGTPEHLYRIGKKIPLNTLSTEDVKDVEEVECEKESGLVVGPTRPCEDDDGLKLGPGDR